MNIQNNIEQQFKLPENILAEKIVLAGIITNSSLVHQTVDIVEPNIFFDKKHQEIYKSITEIHKRKEIVDFLGITNWLTKKNKTECIADLQEIEKLGRKVINNEVFEEYLYLLVDKFLRRSLITGTLFLLEIVANEMTSITAVLNQFEKLFLELSQHSSVSTNKMQITSLLPSVIRGIEKKYRDNTQHNNLYSGFNDLDNLTDGFQRSDLIIIASRPGMGKTAFILNIARNITKQRELSLAFFSLEMTAEQLGYRILASESRVPLSKLRRGEVNTKEWIKIQGAVKVLSKTRLYIDDTPKLTIPKLRGKIYQLLQYNEQLNGVVIDYLQLIESDQGSENRYQVLSSITRSLKIIAREFDIPVIVLSQLSRNLESRTNKRPILADLRESGCVSKNSYINCKDRSIKMTQITKFIEKTTFTANNNKHIVLSSIKQTYLNTSKISYHLLTTSGYCLEVSANHKLLTNSGWKPLSSIARKDLISLIRTYQKSISQLNPMRSKFFQLELEKIDSIYTNKKRSLFDLEMNKNHNFVANRILVHNSIEQDADLVCMLYRDAYYNVEEQDNKIAEVAILKHRNGPTGKVELQFNSQFAEFTEK
nr:DnaB [Erythrotrichia welwitschii]